MPVALSPTLLGEGKEGSEFTDDCEEEMKGTGICSRKEEQPIKGSGENAPESALRLPPEECGEEKRLYKKERDTKPRTPILYRLNGVLRAVSKSCLLNCS